MDIIDHDDFLLRQPFVDSSSAPRAATTASTADSNIDSQPNRCLLRELVPSSWSHCQVAIYQISGPYALDVLFNTAVTTANAGSSSSILFLDADYNDFPLCLNHIHHPQNHHQHSYSKSSLQRIQIIRVETPHEMADSMLTILPDPTTTSSNSLIGFIGVAVSELFWKNDWTTRNTVYALLLDTAAANVNVDVGTISIGIVLGLTSNHLQQQQQPPPSIYPIIKRIPFLRGSYCVKIRALAGNNNCNNYEVTCADATAILSWRQDSSSSDTPHQHGQLNWEMVSRSRSPFLKPNDCCMIDGE